MSVFEGIITNEDPGFPLNPLELDENNLYQTSIALIHGNEEYQLKRFPISYSPTSRDTFHVVKASDELDYLAHNYYGESKYWWVIADANNIINPWKLEVGTNLVIPDLDYIKSHIL